MDMKVVMEKGNSLEILRVIGIHLRLAGVDRRTIADALGVSVEFLDKWYGIYVRHGAEGLWSRHKGSVGYLPETERNEIISYVAKQETMTLNDLISYIETKYGVVYESKQSYYDLLHEGRMSWKKTEKMNPKREESEVVPRREEIKKTPRTSGGYKGRQAGGMGRG